MSETTVLGNGILKGVFTDALAYRGQCTDLDSVMQTGIYRLDKPAGAPVANMYGFLIHVRAGTSPQLQIAVMNYGGGVLYRVHWDQWQSWRRIAASPLAT